MHKEETSTFSKKNDLGSTASMEKHNTVHK